MSSQEIDHLRREWSALGGYMSALMGDPKNMQGFAKTSEDVLHVAQLRASILIAGLLLEIRDNLRSK